MFKNTYRHLGFTLIEIMIVVAIVGILAAIAYPSYVESIKRSNRSEAKSELTDAAQRLQRCYTAYSKFNDSVNCTVYKQLTTGDSKITARGSGYYEITFDTNPAVTATTYKLTAKPIKAPQTNDTKCKEISISQDGQKSAKDSSGNSNDNCW